MKKILIGLLFSISSTIAGAEMVSKSFWGSKAIGGYDTVSYHSERARAEHSATLGNKTYVVKYLAANWYFASQQSADKFQQNPGKYKPTFNGFCANALSLGEGLVPTNGKIWEFFGDQLHLFYAEAGRQRWLKGDWKSYRKVADKAWINLKNG
ncbi:MAG: hypothetical protein OFPII_02040 [Osedax symbiont Rs1]|nr:MAG: hypothetical protein OFPII_02040 [Osedax symbiont Rs1]